MHGRRVEFSSRLDQLFYRVMSDYLGAQALSTSSLLWLPPWAGLSVVRSDNGELGMSLKIV
ncbi:hypothetical protein N9U42_05115 [Luminiphilus sp.]|nr:hypothetical protein [Luminiphilus sp.]MDA9711723.1 hypothetical protein [Luminiphilus sp.]